MGHDLYELHVRLREVEPPIWRTIEVPGVSTLESVHFAIQVAMGWTNSHLHSFDIDECSYGMVDVDGADDLDFDDERRYRLCDLVKRGQSFVYTYDFGDGWQHDITVAKITSVAKKPRTRCTAGARACPPEDCGGPGGYANLLVVLANPRHPDHPDMKEWSGDFKPEVFSSQGEIEGEMTELKEISMDDDSSVDGPMDDLPPALVKMVLALDPMQRASLVALAVGTMASELLDATRLVEQMIAPARAAKPRAKKPR